MPIDKDAPVQFLRTAFHPDDWVAVLLKSHATGGTAQRIGPVALVMSPRFQAWLRSQNARKFSVYVSVNAIRPQRRARTRDAIGEIRHVFLDADKYGQDVLAAIAARRDLPPPSYVLHSSPHRLHVLWRVTGFTKESVEALQKRLAKELGTDKSATSCAQLTRVPGFVNHKYTPGPVVTAIYDESASPVEVDAFGEAGTLAPAPTSPTSRPDILGRARRYVAATPPAIQGRNGDVATFKVCCRLVRGFNLTEEQALSVLGEWNTRCDPPWRERELRAKLRSASRSGKEPFGGLR